MAITLNNLSFSAFLSVDFGNSFGSGFIVNIKDKLYLFTAKHVIFDKNNKLLENLWIKCRNYDTLNEEIFDAQIVLTNKNVITIPNEDIAIVKLFEEFGFHLENAGTNISFAEESDLSIYEDIFISSKIFLVGFPSSLTTDDFYEVDNPLLRFGIVAGKNILKNTFIIDSIAYYGVSGGPIIQEINNEISIIGIVSRYVPFITEWKNRHEPNISRQDFFNSGYAVCIPLNNALNLIANENSKK